MRELRDDPKQLLESMLIQLHRLVLLGQKDAVLLIVSIGRILQPPLFTVQRHADDAVVGAGRMVDAPGIAFVFHAELASRIS
ncbi:hypothetical protein SDC9_73150 [bioreactor metagenome]|uniref:Uncharacterized protein n=1 Tax=bioreactor metagenome TaxID=1076179 RepID=A0A644YDM2_9ZZZZ